MAKEDKDKDVHIYKHKDGHEDFENSRWKVFIYHFYDFVNKDKDSDIGSDLVTLWHSCLCLGVWQFRVSDCMSETNIVAIPSGSNSASFESETHDP